MHRVNLKTKKLEKRAVICAIIEYMYEYVPGLKRLAFAYYRRMCIYIYVCASESERNLTSPLRGDAVHDA